MGEENAINVGPIGIEVAYERFGDPAAPPVLLMMGGGAQMIDWQVRASRVVGSPASQNSFTAPKRSGPPPNQAARRGVRERARRQSIWPANRTFGTVPLTACRRPFRS